MTLRTTRCRPRHSPASSRPANCRWPWPHSSLRAPEIGRPGQGQEPAAEHDPGRCDQAGLDQDGRILPRHHLRQTGLAASLAHLQRNLWGGAGRSGQRVIPACIRRTLGRRHPVIIGRPELPHWRKAESTGRSNLKYGSSPGRMFSIPTSPIPASERPGRGPV